MKGLMMYADARISKELEHMAYQAYISDAAKVITGNTARFAGGSEMTQRYMDIVSGATVEEDKRTAVEIVEDVINRTGLVVIE